MVEPMSEHDEGAARSTRIDLNYNLTADNFSSFTSSVTRWKDYFFNFWSLTTIKIGPIALKIGQNRVLFCKMQNKLSIDCQTIIFLPKW